MKEQDMKSRQRPNTRRLCDIQGYSGVGTVKGEDSRMQTAPSSNILAQDNAGPMSTSTEKLVVT